MLIGWHHKKAIGVCNDGQGACGHPQRSAYTFSRKIRSTPQGLAVDDRESFDEFFKPFCRGDLHRLGSKVLIAIHAWEFRQYGIVSKIVGS